MFKGLDKAFIGMATQGPSQPLAVYDWDKIVKELVRQGMSQKQAEEWVAFNTAESWIGPQTPLIFRKMSFRAFNAVMEEP